MKELFTRKEVENILYQFSKNIDLVYYTKQEIKESIKECLDYFIKQKKVNK